MLLVACGLSLGATPPLAQPLDQLDWTDRKCVLYQHAVDEAIGMTGPEGLRESFMAQNEAFIAGGCRDQGHVCAETDEEIALANLLTVLTMNEGMASTFVPFGCAN